jgi:tellurite resistance protein TehA-like permease
MEKRMIRLLEDLRFFIGTFFVLVGALLTGAGVLTPVETAGQNLNLIVGIAFLIFGAFALIMSVRASK